MRSRLLLGSLGVGAMLFIVGCGGGPKPIPVAGILTLDDKPLPDARVVFNPVDSNGRLAFGITDSEGRFKLTTFNHNDGALAGQYKITINVVGPTRVVDSSLATNFKALMADRDRNLKNKPPQVHDNYLNVARTPLIQDVPPPDELKLYLRKDGT